MPQVIDVPGYGPTQFPDGMSDADITAAIQKNMNVPKVAPQEPSAMQQIGSAVIKGMPAGPIGIATSLGQTAMGAGDRLIGNLGYKAGGLTTDLATNLGASPAVAAGTGTVANAAVQALPSIVAGKLATSAAPLLDAGAKRLMQSALKPTIADLRTGRAANAIQTMLDQGVNVTPGGVMKLKSKIADLNNEISSAIANSTATVDKAQVASELQGTLDKFRKQVNPDADVKTILNAWDEFMNHPLLPKLVPEQTVASPILNESGKAFTSTIPASGSNAIPVQLAQEIKQRTGGILGKKNAYGQMGTADVEAQKTLVRGLKEGIANAVPEISDLNAAESKMLDALKVNERRVLISANKNPMGLSLLSMNPQAWAAFMADKSEAFKSLLSRMMYSGQGRIPQAIVGTGIAAGQGLFGQQPSLINPTIR